MTSGRLALAELIRRAAADLPLKMAEGIAAVIESSGSAGAGAMELAIGDAAPQIRYRELALDLVKVWKSQAPELCAQSVAFALVAAARCEEHVRRDEHVDLVWTGPDVQAVALTGARSSFRAPT